ncbi:RpiB/LacA/LacB family sugar-phosphate isomerase [Dysgonomonas sp. 216]|uniref:RpiB/LacA/LacB family sugar-phosphate isomerase n=1 Tax=Dysgonomonas sp. 216 TaxID=2302934 RepID=UPI0013D0CFF0|nr:RpiB/LacA/LacB family sugar-phosphate isomerase [Dysgonomonas sp. 216]NDW17887.1 RpiB/LacA/LacB family sugar-phosphate isomerase [Dysgonomonas sp. 216]
MEEKSLIQPTDKPIGICSDHAGYPMKMYLISLLDKKGIAYKDFGAYSMESSDYADFAHPMASAVENGECYPGIAICASGNGINMSVNKHQNIRAALCWTEELAFFARAHNNANVLTLPGLYIPLEEAHKILITFLNSSFEGGRHQRRIDKIPCGENSSK